MEFLKKLVFLIIFLCITIIKAEKTAEVDLTDETIQKLVGGQKLSEKEQIRLRKLLNDIDFEHQKKLIELQEKMRLDNEKKLDQARIEQREKELVETRKQYDEARKKAIEDNKALADYEAKIYAENETKLEKLRTEQQENLRQKNQKDARELADYQEKIRLYNEKNI